MIPFFYQSDRKLLTDLLSAVNKLVTNQEKLMATQAELTEQVKAISATLTKIGGETTTLLQKVSDLQAVIANGPPVTPELQAAVDALAAQAKVVDDLVPDATPPG